MPLVSDSTALMALGAVGLSSLLLRHFGDVHIGETVRAEVRRAAAEVDAGIAAGWLPVHRVDPAQVATFKQQSRLHAGEAEAILLESRLPRPATLLVDERRAFNVANRTLPRLALISVGHVLTLFEAAGDIASASSVLATLLAGGDYAWAPNVHRSYQRWLTSRSNTAPGRGP